MLVGKYMTLHVGKLWDGPMGDTNGVTFYTINITADEDLKPADRDLFRYGTVPFSREGMLKFLQNGNNAVTLYPTILPQ